MLTRQGQLLTGWSRTIRIAFTCIGIILAINHVFHLQLFMIMENSYFYLLLAVFLSVAFLLFPAKKGVRTRKFLCLDILLFSLAVGISSYFASLGYEIIYRGWGYIALPHLTVMSVILWLLILEALRRTTGLVLAIVVLAFSLYPMYAGYMPAFLEGLSYPFATTAVFHILGEDSLMGLVMKVFGRLLVGFMIFAVALQTTGGGKFFLNLAFSLLGRSRGGPAKVSVLASALFGSMSGSVIPNVVTTGAITIPAMKRAGYEPHYAGAIEACSSTGGVLMPPIMGAVAFIMVGFLNISYIDIIFAAAIPSVLYYFGLLLQVDAYAAKNGIKGLPKDEIPSFSQTLKEGWIYLLAIAVLVYFLVFGRVIAQAPFYATAALLIVCMIQKETRFTLKSFIQFIEATGKTLTELVAMIAAVGLIIGGLSIVGVGSSIARELVLFAGGNLGFMLILGALASFILGMGMSVSACYVFLAIVLAPALVMVGLNEIAVHLFVMYYGMLSYITPPVAMATFPAATLSGSTPMKVAITATRLGGVLYILPFFFVLNPALVLQASIGEILVAVGFTLVATFLISGGLQGYLTGIGRIRVPIRIPVVGSGILIGLPGWQIKTAGLAIAIVSLLPMLVLKLRAKKPA